MAEQSIACPSCGRKIPLTRALRAEIEQSVEREVRAKYEARLDSDLHHARKEAARKAEEKIAEEHRLKDAEKDRQLADLRRQIEDLKRKAEQGSQQLQGEVGEEELETLLRSSFPADDISAIGQGVRGADLHQVVIDSRGRKCGSILWECKNTRNWNDAWLAKLKQDQRAQHADLAVLVSAVLPKGCRRFVLVDGVLVTNFACAPCLAGVLRANLFALAQTRSAAMHKEEKLELLHRYLSGVDFRQRVEAVVEAFTAMRDDLEQERRAAERQWARRARQIDAVTLNVAGMYGDLQGILPALPSIRLLELPATDVDAAG